MKVHAVLFTYALALGTVSAKFLKRSLTEIDGLERPRWTSAARFSMLQVYGLSLLDDAAPFGEARQQPSRQGAIENRRAWAERRAVIRSRLDSTP
eukprot:IDg12555t1